MTLKEMHERGFLESFIGGRANLEIPDAKLFFMGVGIVSFDFGCVDRGGRMVTTLVIRLRSVTVGNGGGITPSNFKAQSFMVVPDSSQDLKFGPEISFRIIVGDGRLPAGECHLMQMLN